MKVLNASCVDSDTAITCLLLFIFCVFSEVILEDIILWFPSRISCYRGCLTLVAAAVSVVSIS